MPQVATRKSPIVIVRDFIALQFCAAALYYLAGTVAYYAQIWRGLGIDEYVEFPVAQMAFLFVAETLLILYIFSRWHRETFRFSGGRLLHDEGVFVRRHTALPLERAASVAWTWSIVGRLAGYGTVTVRDADGKRVFREGSIPEPREFAAQLSGYASVADADPLRLVGQPESARLERKASLRWDRKTKGVNRALERAALKTVAAFMNSGGGHLVVGVGDDGTVHGLEEDFATLARRDADGWENHLSNLLAAAVGSSFRQYVQVRHFTHGGRPCALVTVAPTPKPAYVRDDERDEFFIRTGNRTASLRMREAHEYIAGRFS